MNTKNNRVDKTTLTIELTFQPVNIDDIAPVEALPVEESDNTTDKTITPIISSSIAADTIVVPIFELSFPNSFRVATVTDTVVADNITP
jgi:hypothetical protein